MVGMIVEAGSSRFQSALAALGLAVDDIAEVVPSLEDVFLDVVEKAGGAGR